MNLPKPLGVYVLIRQDDFSKKTAGGLYMPDISKKGEYLVQGTVIAIGPGYKDNGITVPIEGIEVGDKVFYQKTATFPWKADDGQEYYFLAASNLIANLGAQNVKN